MLWRRLQALKFRGGVPDRRGRKPTRAEKGSYIDDGDLQREVPVFRPLPSTLLQLGSAPAHCSDCKQQLACGTDKLLADAQLEDIAIKVPDDISLYNLRDAAPGIYMPRSDALEELIRYGREHMDEVLGDVSGSSPSFPGVLA